MCTRHVFCCIQFMYTKKKNSTVWLLELCYLNFTYCCCTQMNKWQLLLLILFILYRKTAFKLDYTKSKRASKVQITYLKNRRKNRNRKLMLLVKQNMGRNWFCKIIYILSIDWSFSDLKRVWSFVANRQATLFFTMRTMFQYKKHQRTAISRAPAHNSFECDEVHWLCVCVSRNLWTAPTN